MMLSCFCQRGLACFGTYMRGRWTMFWLLFQTIITHVKLDAKLELRDTIVHNKVEVALAGIPEPQAKNFIKFGMEIVSFFLSERHNYNLMVVIVGSLKR